MRFGQSILAAVVALSFVAYAFDCAEMTTPEQAMQCCNSMPCSSQGHHGQDCCKTMPSMHGPFVQPSAGHSAGPSLNVGAVLPVSDDPIDLASSSRNIRSHWHAPPGFLPSSPLPLRI